LSDQITVTFSSRTAPWILSCNPWVRKLTHPI